MPPKPKESPKKANPTVIRQAISNSSLVFVPKDVLEGFESRLETDIDWTLLANGVRSHKALCKREDIPRVTFSEAVENKISKSIIHGFVNEESGLTLEQHWEFLLPVKLWDNERFTNEEAKICYLNNNCITDDLVDFIKNSIKSGDRKILRDAMKMVNVLRVNDSEISELDEGLAEYKKLVTLNLCGNFLADLNADLIPPSVKILELQTNRFSDISGFAESLPTELLYLGLSKNFFTSENIDAIKLLPFNLTVLDLSDNDIYHLDPVLQAVARLPNLSGLQLSGNPCSVSTAYARATLTKLTRLRWLDCREILATDRPAPAPASPVEIHPDDLRSAYFHFTVFRIMSVLQPPKTEKGVLTSFHVELEIPLLDVVRRKFLMFRRNESLIEMLPPAEDDEWPPLSSLPVLSKLSPSIEEELTSQVSDIYNSMAMRNPREIHNFTTFESNKVQWSKMMNFQEPTLKIFCPDLTALRDTFRSVITVRLIYTITHAPQKLGKQKVSTAVLATPGDMRVTVATIRCALKNPDWSQPSQHFHWDETLGTNDAIHWGDGDLAILQYSHVEKATKAVKGKTEGAESTSRQIIPDELTCHFGFGIETLK